MHRKLSIDTDVYQSLNIRDTHKCQDGQAETLKPDVLVGYI